VSSRGDLYVVKFEFTLSSEVFAMPLVAILRLSLLWILCFGIAIVSWRFLPMGVEAAMGFVAYHAELRPLAFFAHVGLAPLALMLMPFQLLPRLRARRPSVHRWIGRSYAVLVLLSGLGGLAMAVGTEAGPIAATGFALLAVLWLATTAIGVWKARAGDIAAHRQWMIRSAALIFAGVTLRLELPLLIASGLEFPAAYTTVAWLCWAPNLLVAEWILRKDAGRVGRPAALA
jgi:uncharacterized membrane protein